MGIGNILGSMMGLQPPSGYHENPRPVQMPIPADLAAAPKTQPTAELGTPGSLPLVFGTNASPLLQNPLQATKESPAMGTLGASLTDQTKKPGGMSVGT
jgi:hypothetical protein